jgi:hypothetical protein
LTLAGPRGSATRGHDRRRLYGVRFAARELWGEAAGAHDTVILDLWDSYPDPACEAPLSAPLKGAAKKPSLQR